MIRQIKSRYQVNDGGIEIGSLDKEYRPAIGYTWAVGYVPGGVWWTFYADDGAEMYPQHTRSWKTLREAMADLRFLDFVRCEPKPRRLKG